MRRPDADLEEKREPRVVSSAGAQKGDRIKPSGRSLTLAAIEKRPCRWVPKSAELVENGRSRRASNLDLPTKLDDPVRRDAEELGCIERQFRHAANQFLWELPAGTLDPGEDPLLGAQRELEEETGYRARKWRPLVRYFASPGFLGEFMQVFVAEGLTLGDAQPEYDEQIEIEMMPLSRLLKMMDEGKIYDGKTLISVMLYVRLREIEKKKNRK